MSFFGPGRSDCFRCGETVSTDEKASHVHDVCSKLEDIEFAQKYLALAHSALVNDDAEKAAAHVEMALCELLPAFDWEQPVAVKAVA